MPSLKTNDLFSVGKVKPVLIGATPEAQKKVINTAGGKLFYKTAENVSTSDTEIAVGSSVTFEATAWIISETESRVEVENLEAPTFQDVTVKDMLSVSGTSTIASATAVPGFYAGQWNPATAETGTDTTPAEKKLFVTSLFLPCNKMIKGIGYLIGSVGGTNKVVAGLFSATGEILAHSSETTEGATVGTAKEIQELELTSEYKATGPAVYYIGITMNGNTARFRSIPKNTAGSNVFSGEVTLAAKNVLAKITAPSAFAADKGPVCWVY